MLAVGGVGSKIKHEDGIPSRFNFQVSKAYDENQRKELTNKYKLGNYLYFIEDRYTDLCKEALPFWKETSGNLLNCAFQNKKGKNNIAIVGSSHASHLFYGLKEYYKDTENSIALFPSSGQSPFLDLQLSEGPFKNGSIFIEKAYEYITSKNYIKTVILVDFAQGIYKDLRNISETNQRTVYQNAVKRSLDKLKQFNILVLLDSPTIPFNPNVCFYRPLTFKKTVKSCPFEYSNSIAKIHNDIILTVAKEYSNVRVLDLSTLFCHNNQCKAAKNDQLLFQDNQHLSIEGSLFVAPYIAKELAEF